MLANIVLCNVLPVLCHDLFGSRLIDGIRIGDRSKSKPYIKLNYVTDEEQDEVE